MSHLELKDRDLDLRTDFESLTSLFQRQVDRQPERPALVLPTHHLTYRALAASTGRLVSGIHARFGRLTEEDTRPIALLFPHDADLLVAILATCRSGRIYTPLDPDAPDARLRRQVAHAEPAAVLTHASYRGRAEHITNGSIPVLTLEDIAVDPEAMHPDGVVPPDEELGDDGAYLLYTSGTTGEPKGIVHSRRSLLRSVRHYCSDLDVRSSDRIGLILPASYTPSVFCIFGSFLSGAALCPFDLKQNSVDAMLDWIENQKVTLLYATPTIFRRMTSRCRSGEQLKSLRSIQLAGEPLYASDVSSFQRIAGDHVELYNGMGTTETSCVTRFFIPPSAKLPETPTVPIGIPYDDMAVELVDRSGSVISGAGEGELVLRSEFFARGYWKRPDLTRDRFRPAPNQTERTYRTGDWVRRLDSGDLVHLGRMDTQVKLRGIRIELEEIESVLLRVQGVEEAAAVLVETGPGSPFIAGFFAPQLPLEPVRNYLSNQLPPHMIPTRLVALDGLPLTASGKVARTKLEQHRFRTASHPDTSPTSVFEEATLRVFREVMQDSDMGLDDDFFESGGDSITAVELSIALERQLAVPLNISALIEAPTPRGLAAMVERSAYAPSSRRIVRFSGDGSKATDTTLFCLPGIGGNALTFRAVGKELKDAIQTYAFDYPGSAEGEQATSSIPRLAHVCAHEVARMAPSGPIALLCFSVGGVVGLELAHRLKRMGRRVELVVLVDCFTPEVIRARYLIDQVRAFAEVGRAWLTGRGNAEDEDIPLHQRRSDAVSRGLRRAVATYRPRTLSVERAVLFVAEDEPRHVFGLDNHAQWTRLFGPSIESIRVPGDHRFLIQPAQAPAFANFVREALGLSEPRIPMGWNFHRFESIWAFKGASQPELRPANHEEIPPTLRRLLDRDEQLTRALSQHTRQTIHPEILTSRQEGRYYTRKTVLRRGVSGRPAAIAAIIVAMDILPAEAKIAILRGEKPLGTVFSELQIPHQCRLMGLLKASPTEDVQKALEIESAPTVLFGRQTRFSTPTGQPLVDVLEILAPDL
ncbi:MAG: alpha/beta fold hydrolase [Myxococcota bacterium]